MIMGIRIWAFLGLAAVAAVLVLVASKDSTTALTQFEPGVVFCFENVDTPASCDGDPSPGASSDIKTRFCTGWNLDCSTKDSPVVDSNFGAVVGFTPTSINVGQGLPPGTIAGRLTAESTLGLINGPCNTIIGVAFTLMVGSTDITNTIDPKPVGEADVMEPLALDANGNGVPDGADKYPSFLNEFFDPDGVPLQPVARLFGISRIQGSWIVLNFNFFEPGTTLEAANTRITFKPEWGYPSVTLLQNPTAPAAPGAISDFCAPLLSENIALGISKDNPCSGSPTGFANCPGQGTTLQNRGYPLFPCETGNTNDEDRDGKINDGCPQVNSVSETGAECDNNVSDDPEDSDVNDGCPQFGEHSEAGRIPGTCSGTDEGGCVNRANPTAPGPISFHLLTASQRDADGDGIENGLDVCFGTANAEWNPRAADPVNDADGDGLPKQCDPDDAVPSGPSQQGCKAGFVGLDQDADCFSNRADNCPLVSQLVDPSRPPGEGNQPVAEDKDLDGIGDKCDPNPDVPNGLIVSLCMEVTVQVAQGASTAPVAPNIDTNGPDCAAAAPVQVVNTPVPPPNVTGGPGGGATQRPGGGGPGIGGPGESGIGSLSPTGSGAPIWAAALVVAGGIGILAGIGMLHTIRVRKRSDSE